MIFLLVIALHLPQKVVIFVWSITLRNLNQFQKNWVS